MEVASSRKRDAHTFFFDRKQQQQNNSDGCWWPNHIKWITEYFCESRRYQQLILLDYMHAVQQEHMTGADLSDSTKGVQSVSKDCSGMSQKALHMVEAFP